MQDGCMSHISAPVLCFVVVLPLLLLQHAERISIASQWPSGVVVCVSRATAPWHLLLLSRKNGSGLRPRHSSFEVELPDSLSSHVQHGTQGGTFTDTVLTSVLLVLSLLQHSMLWAARCNQQSYGCVVLEREGSGGALLSSNMPCLSADIALLTLVGAGACCYTSFGAMCVSNGWKTAQYDISRVLLQTLRLAGSCRHVVLWAATLCLL